MNIDEDVDIKEEVNIDEDDDVAAEEEVIIEQHIQTSDRNYISLSCLGCQCYLNNLN